MKTGILGKEAPSGEICETTVWKAWVSFYGSVCQSMHQVDPSADGHFPLPYLTAFPNIVSKGVGVGLLFLV